MSQPLNSDPTLHPLTVHEDKRGKLIAIEGGIDVPFEIARTYYIYGTRDGASRGFHAHRRLTEYAVAVNGSCTMVLDDGASRHEIRLAQPEAGLLITSMMWREMTNFSDDCVLLVLADAHYDEADYIRDYDAFLAAVREAQ